MLKHMRTKNGRNVDLERLMEDVRVVVRDGEALLKTGMSEFKERAIAGAKTTDETLRKYPYQSMGAVFGLGVLVGVLCATMLTRGQVDLDDY
jgi:ElaB/YqjD/DUF883 family membrane-anchored ribosome-binding protein